MEEKMTPTVTASPAPTGDSPFRGQVIDTLEKALAAATAGAAAFPQTAQASAAPSPSFATPPVQSDIPVAPATLPAAPSQPRPQPVVSTGPVPDDVSSRFLDPPPADLSAPTDLPVIPPDTAIEPPEGLTEKANYAWQEIRSREKAARQAAEQYKEQLEKITKDAANVAQERVKFTDELKNRDDRINQLEEELGKLDLTHRPEFRQRYDTPMEQIAQKMESALADAAEIDDPDQITDAVNRLLSVSDSEFNRLVQRLSPSAQGSLWDKRREYMALADSRDHAIEEWRMTQAGTEAVDAQQQIVQRSQRRHDIAEKAIDFAKNLTPPDQRLSVLSESTYAGDVENVDRSFRGFMQEAKEEDIARAAYQGFLMPVVQRQLAFLQQALEQWRDAYYQVRGMSNPPALPMRVQAAARVAAPPPAIPPVEPGRNFQSTLQNTVEATLRRAGLG